MGEVIQRDVGYQLRLNMAQNQVDDSYFETIIGGPGSSGYSAFSGYSGGYGASGYSGVSGYSGSGGLPGGVSGYVQFNGGSTFVGSSNIIYDDTNANLSIGYGAKANPNIGLAVKKGVANLGFGGDGTYGLALNTGASTATSAWSTIFTSGNGSTTYLNSKSPSGNIICSGPSPYNAQICSIANTTAGYFTDGTRIAKICDGTYAINATGGINSTGNVTSAGLVIPNKIDTDNYYLKNPLGITVVWDQMFLECPGGTIALDWSTASPGGFITTCSVRPGGDLTNDLGSAVASKRWNNLYVNDVVADNAYYIGQKDVDGSWRFIKNGADLDIEKRVTGVWVVKQTITG